MIVRDLSQAYANGMAHAPTTRPPAIRRVKSVATHIGTHIGAPSYLLADGSTIDQLSLEDLIRSAMVFSLERNKPKEIDIFDLKAFGAGISRFPIAEKCPRLKDYLLPTLRELHDVKLARPLRYVGAL